MATLVSKPLSAEAARAKCEEAADVIVARKGGHWDWLDDRRLRVYEPNGDPFATLHLESLQ
jgi:hypothetical protein